MEKKIIEQKFVYLKAQQPFLFRFEKSNDVKIESLGLFLSCEIISQRTYDYFMNWLNDPKIGLCGNAYCLYLRNDKVYLSQVFEPEEKTFDFFYCSTEELFNIINQWVKVVDSNPDEILITQENNVVKIARTDGVDCGNKPTIINQDQSDKVVK